jgi:hypothetical protein
MTPYNSTYNPSPGIVEISRKELQKISSLIAGRENDRERSITVLIGGWAVDAYNSYYGSQDIDLVTDDSTRLWLIDHLKTSEGYIDQFHYPFDTVIKKTPHGDVILDLLSRETQDPFEGHPEIPFTLDILTGNTVIRKVGRGAEIPVPNRSILVFLKLKAAWDRRYRIFHQKSGNPDWESGKMIKDCADILALIDPNYGGREIDLEILGGQLSRVEFLKEIIVRIPDIDAVRSFYQGMSEPNIRRVCEDLISIL